jgi:hypothetical protein
MLDYPSYVYEKFINTTNVHKFTIENPPLKKLVLRNRYHIKVLLKNRLLWINLLI